MGSAVIDRPQPLEATLAGRYRIERELGSGAMATVYEAEDTRHHRRVAVKVHKPELALALGGDRFAREIEIVARLHHPNILPLFDSGNAEHVPFFVMPLVHGETLRERLNREKQLPLDESLRIVSEIGGALAHAHHEGVLHRDVTPDNILLDGDHALIAD